MNAQTRRLLWWALCVGSPVLYGTVAFILSRTGYEAPLVGRETWGLVFLGAGLVQFLLAIQLRGRILALPVGDQRYVLALAWVDAIALQGLLAYLLFGSGSLCFTLVVVAVLVGLLIRPPEVP